MSNRTSSMRRSMVSLAVLAALAAATVGCVRTKYTLVNPSAQRNEPVAPENVIIMTDEAELGTLEYTRVAIIEATGSGEFTDQTDMLEAMRERAGKIGANAILLPQINEPGAGAKVAAAVFGTGTQRKGNVVALRILGPRKKLPTGAASFWTRAAAGIRILLE